MNETTKFIHKTVYCVIVESVGSLTWIKHRHSIRRRLEQLEPDVPDDSTSGFLAYNVSKDKPRMKIKIGRFFTKKLQLNSGYLNDQTIQKISSTVSLHLWPDIRTELIKGSDITDAYENCIGSTSCMTGSCASYTRLYEVNPTRFQMLTMFYNDNSARAIVHKLDNGKFLLGRVYSDCEELKTKMVEYARKKNWYYHVKGAVYLDGQAINDYDEIIVSGLFYNEGEVPFMDTLAQYRLCNDGKIDIFHGRAPYSNDGTLNNTCGELENRACCESCGELVCEDDVCCMDDMVTCRDCYNDSYSYCECCNNDYLNDDAVHIIDDNIYVCSDCVNNNGDYSYCEGCGEYHSASTTETSDGMVLCESCLLDEYTLCESCNKWMPSGDINDDGLCEDCIEEQSIPVQNGNDTEKLPFEESIRNAIIE